MDKIRNRDLFDHLSLDLIHIILFFLITQKKINTPIFKGICSVGRFKGKFLDTKQAVQTIILSKRFLKAWSTFPHLNFTDISFSQSLLHIPPNPNQFQQASISMERQRFANHVLQTLTRYQQLNIPITTLRLTCHVGDDDNILHQSISKAKENRVKEVYLHMVHFRPSNLLQTIFSLKQLVSLILHNCELLVNNGGDLFVDFFALRVLKLNRVTTDEYVLHKLIHSCRLIEEIKLKSCKGVETIQIPDHLPYLKRLKVFTVRHQRVHVKSESLERMIYGYNSSLNIESARNLKILKLMQCSYITDENFHNLLAKLPVLEELTILNCDQLQKINISSQSLSFLSIIVCMRLMEVKIDAPTLNMFQYHGGVRVPISFANGGCGKIKSDVILDLDDLGEASSFLELREFLATLKQSDNLTLDISSTEFSFDRNVMDEKNIPEFEQVHIRVSSPSSTYSTIMEGLLWSFSPKIISLKNDSWEYKEFIMHICKELLVQHDDDHSTISTTNAFSSWGKYFKQAKFKDRDDNWRPLHSWKSLADVLENLGDEYILKLSHD